MSYQNIGRDQINADQLDREAKLKRAIVESIIILDESRKAFKSKQIEALRKKLTQILIDVT